MEQTRGRNERDDMKGEIRGWEETTLRKRGGRRKGGERGIKEKSVGAVHTEKMTRGGREGMLEEERGRGEGVVYLSSGYFGNMDSELQAASFKVEQAIARS